LSEHNKKHSTAIERFAFQKLVFAFFHETQLNPLSI